MIWPKTFIVSGTDTGVGKTVVSALLTRGLSASYWKPIQAGLDEATDLDVVRNWTQLSDTHFHPEAYRLKTPASPHLAASIDGLTISFDALSIPMHSHSHLIIEGAGGLMVPLNDEELMIDLFAYWKLPVLLVARSTLGTLNHTLLSIEALKSRGVPILGLVLNGPTHQSNRDTLEKWGGVAVLGMMSELSEMTPQGLDASFARIFGEQWPLDCSFSSVS